MRNSSTTRCSVSWEHSNVPFHAGSRMALWILLDILQRRCSSISFEQQRWGEVYWCFLSIKNHRRCCVYFFSVFFPVLSTVGQQPDRVPSTAKPSAECRKLRVWQNLPCSCFMAHSFVPFGLLQSGRYLPVIWNMGCA